MPTGMPTMPLGSLERPESLWVRVRFGQDRQLLLLLLQEEGAFAGLSLTDQHDIRCMIREREVANTNLS